MRPLQQIIVKAPGKHYPVVCGKGALRRVAGMIAQLGPTTGVYVLSSPRVWRHCGGTLQGALPRTDRQQVILFDDREAAKNLETFEQVVPVAGPRRSGPASGDRGRRRRRGG